jgi:hypothetical protein
MSDSFKTYKFSCVFFLLLIFFFACEKRDDCDYINQTESYDDIKDFRKIPIGGAYKVSSLSTDLSFTSEKLSNSTLYIIADSMGQNVNRFHGNFYFQQYPAWDNFLRKNQLDDFYGHWNISNSSSGFNLNTSFGTSDTTVSKAIVARNGIRLKDGVPIIIVRIMKSVNFGSDHGYLHIFPTTSSKDYCNYLIYEKTSDKVDDDIVRNAQEFILDYQKAHR